MKAICRILALRQWEQVKEASDSRQDSEVPCSICQVLRMSCLGVKCQAGPNGIG